MEFGLLFLNYCVESIVDAITNLLFFILCKLGSYFVTSILYKTMVDINYNNTVEVVVFIYYSNLYNKLVYTCTYKLYKYPILWVLFNFYGIHKYFQTT